MNDKCPWCNAKCSFDGKSRSWYTCGTSVRDQYDRGIDCVRRELQLTINRMQPVVVAAMAWHKLSGSSADLIQEIEKYKEAE